MDSHPDSNIHPCATGEAKSTVVLHQDETVDLQFYAGWFCPFAQRVWITLEEKGIPYRYVEVNPYNKPAALLRLNPRGLVPALEISSTSTEATHTGSQKALYESSIICEFLDDAFHDQGNALLSREDPYEKARHRLWVDFAATRIVSSFHRCLQSHGEALELERQKLYEHIKEFTAAMDPTGPYFAGTELSLPDVILAPWAVRLWILRHYKGINLDLPPSDQDNDGDEKTLRRWRTWVNAIERRPSVRKTLSEKQYYLPMYQRYADNTAQSELAKAIRERQDIP